MTIKELECKLDSYYHHRALKDAINRLKTLQDEYEALYDTSGSINYDGMPHNPSPGNPPLEAVCKMDDKPETLLRLIKEQRQTILSMTHMDELIESALHTLTPLKEEIIHLKHCERDNFKGIAKKLHYSESWVKHLYFDALYKILSFIKDSTKKH